MTLRQFWKPTELERSVERDKRIRELKEYSTSLVTQISGLAAERDQLQTKIRELKTKLKRLQKR